MNRPRVSFLVAIVCAGVLAAAAASHALPLPASGKESAMPPVSPEHARLAALCGEWHVELTFWFKPGTPSVSSKGTSTIRPLFDGQYIEEKIEGAFNGSSFSTLAWTGYNTATRQYEATRISSTSPGRIAESGTFDEATKTFELKADYVLAGDTWHQRTVIQLTSADAMVATSYLSFGGVPEWKAVEMKYTRKAK